LFAAAAAVLLFLVPTPYAAYQPGIAFDTAQMVETSSPDAPGQGSFYMTTVLLTPATFWTAVRSTWDDDLQLLSKASLLRGSTEAEYKRAQTVVMRASQADAIEAAYRAAGVRYRIAPDSVMVADAGDGGSRLQTGDVIETAGGAAIRSVGQLIEAVRKVGGGIMKTTVLREGKELEVAIEVNRIAGAEDSGVSPTDAAGSEPAEAALALGVAELAELHRIVPNDPAKEVVIHADDIGGPSAGLMFALQAVDELTPGDLTAGQRIAGTGTIAPDGAVGPIGGVSHKVAAAAKAGARWFLVPLRNAAEAKEKAERLGGSINVVPVSSLQDSIAKLRSLSGR
jgi:PDZ domain-containing protein